MWTTEEQRRRDHLWALTLGTLAAGGGWSLARAPRDALRHGWSAALAALVVTACCGVSAAAVWGGREYARIPARVMTWAILVLWALVLTARDPVRVPGVSLPALAIVTVLLYPLNQHLSEPL